MTTKLTDEDRAVNGDTVDTVRPVFQLVEWRQGEDSQLKPSLPSVTVGRDATINDIKCQVAAGLNLLGISSTLSGEGHGSIHPLPHEDDDDKILSGGSRHYGVSLGFEALKKLAASSRDHFGNVKYFALAPVHNLDVSNRMIYGIHSEGRACFFRRFSVFFRAKPYPKSQKFFSLREKG